MQIEGTPRWIDSEHYSIDAKAAGNPPGTELYGPMTQALLEDRFKLKGHRITREASKSRLSSKLNCVSNCTRRLLLRCG
jgi:uncharacterized protein (TIGR03435 family)